MENVAKNVNCFFKFFFLIWNLILLNLNLSLMFMA